MTPPAPTALVLAAGAGRRLGGSVPKPLVTIDGVPVLRSLLEQVAATFGPPLVAVTTGSRVGDAVASWSAAVAPTIIEVPGPPLSDLRTVAATIEWWRGDLVLVDGDLVVASSLLEAHAATPGSAVVVEHREPGAPVDMRVAASDGRLTALGKHLPPHETVAEFTGISRISAADLETFATCVVRRARDDAPGSYEDAITDLASVTDIGLSHTPRPGMWMDIDTPADLARAREMADSIRRA